MLLAQKVASPIKEAIGVVLLKTCCKIVIPMPVKLILPPTLAREASLGSSQQFKQRQTTFQSV